jgi:hypothetical protein
MESMLGGNDPSTVRPVVREMPGDWYRLGPGLAEALPDGRRLVIWHLDQPGDLLEVATCYPYGQPELESLTSESQGYWVVEEIGVSESGRSLLRLSNYRQLDSLERPGLFLMARQHSGETPGSWVLDGFLREIAKLGSGAPLVWAIPLANIDGVEEGRYGKDDHPYDLNRAWGVPPLRHEVLVYKRDMKNWIRRCEPLMGLDFHAPGMCESSGIYSFLPHPGKWAQINAAASASALVLGQALGEYAADPFGRVAEYKSRWDTPGFSSYCCSEGFPAQVIETPYSLVGDTVMTRETYRDAGSRIARAVTGNLGTVSGKLEG